MSGKNNFFNKTYPKATKDSSGGVVPENNIQNQPSVIYKEIFITPYNIESFRSGRLHLFGGEYISGTNNIVVYRYYIHKNLQLLPDDPIRQRVEYYRQHEHITIKHELKHMDNDKFGNPLFLTQNYYELCGIYAFDEVSAYSAEYIQNSIPTHEEICEAVLLGLDDMLEKQYYYIPNYAKQIQGRFRKDVESIKQNLEQQLYPPIRYSNKFKAVVSGYMTFGGQRFYDTHKKIPDDVRKKLKELRHVCEDNIQQTLQSILNQTNQIQQ